MDSTKIGRNKFFFLVFLFLLVGSFNAYAEVPIIKIGVPNVSKLNSNSSDWWDNENNFTGSLNENRTVGKVDFTGGRVLTTYHFAAPQYTDSASVTRLDVSTSNTILRSQTGEVKIEVGTSNIMAVFDKNNLSVSNKINSTSACFGLSCDNPGIQPLVVIPTTGEGIELRESDNGNPAVILSANTVRGTIETLDVGVRTILLNGADTADSYFDTSGLLIGGNWAIPHKLSVYGTTNLSGATRIEGTENVTQDIFIGDNLHFSKETLTLIEARGAIRLDADKDANSGGSNFGFYIDNIHRARFFDTAGISYYIFGDGIGQRSHNFILQNQMTANFTGDVLMEKSGIIMQNLSVSDKINSTKICVNCDNLEPGSTATLAGNVDVGYTGENIDRTITIHGSSVSAKRTLLKQGLSSFTIQGMVGAQTFIIGAPATTANAYATHVYRISSATSGSFQWQNIAAELMRLNNTGLFIKKDLDVAGNTTAENVHLPVYISAHTNNTIPVISAGVFENVTFDHEADEFKRRITHTFNDNTNITFTIIDTGIYEIMYTLTFEDSQATPLNHIVTRVMRNNVELEGFTIEEDTTKQNADLVIHHSDLVELTNGDDLQLQFTSDATTVSLITHLTYGNHQNTGHITIKRIA